MVSAKRHPRSILLRNETIRPYSQPLGDDARDLGIASTSSRCGRTRDARDGSGSKGMISFDAIIAFYDRHAGECATAYDALSAEAVWSSMGDLFFVGPDRLALDVGAGSGRDAAWLASRGFEVVAAEPAPGCAARACRVIRRLRWIDDRLPRSLRLKSPRSRLRSRAARRRLDARAAAGASTRLPQARDPAAALRPDDDHAAPRNSRRRSRSMHSMPLGEIEALARDHGPDRRASDHRSPTSATGRTFPGRASVSACPTTAASACR